MTVAHLVSESRISLRSVLIAGTVPLVLGTFVLWLAAITETAFWMTAILAALVCLAGIGLINMCAVVLEDERIQNIGYAFLLKMLLILPLLQFGWIPQLDPLSTSFGYDPQRYYFDAGRLAANNFDITALDLSLNYTGILFYYGIAFRVFGTNPVVPALLNALVTLIATLVVLVVGYHVRAKPGRWDWTLGLCFLLPEVLWFDLITARETLAMSLIVLAVLPVGWVLIREPLKVRSLPVAFMISLFSILALSVVRTSMLLPVILSIVAFVAIGPAARRHRLTLFIGLLPVFIVVAIGPTLAERIGGYRWGYLEWLQLVRSPAYLSQIDPSWSEQSVGRRLIPGSLVEELPFGFVRMGAYLAAPIPNVQTTITGLQTGGWSDWQSLMSTLSAIIYLSAFPLALASLWETVRTRGVSHGIVFHIPFWFTFASIGIANLTINERYRVMMAPLLWACLWLGRAADPALLARTVFGWSLLICFGGLFFAAVKW